jgi:hypothetical protein
MNSHEENGQPERHGQLANTPEGAPRAQAVSVPEVVIGTHFKMIWLTITGLTLMLALADILLSVLIKNPTTSTQQAIAMCDTFAKVGFGGIFGMVGAKALG